MNLDIAQVTDFLSLIYKNKTEGGITLAALPSKANKQFKASEEAAGRTVGGLQYLRKHHQITSTEDLKKFLTQFNGVSNLYFRQGRMRRGSAGRQRKDVVEVCNLWVDIDCRNFGAIDEQIPAAQQALEQCPVPPTAVVHSGGGVQAHWVLNTPETNFNKVEAANKLLALLFNGDNVHTVQSCMRLPGTFNMNYSPPREAVVLMVDAQRAYDIDDLLSFARNEKTVLYGPDKNIPLLAQLNKEFDELTDDEKSQVLQEAAKLQGGSSLLEKDWEEIVEQLAQPGHINNAITSCAGRLIKEGHSVQSAIVWIQKQGCTAPATEIAEIVQRIAEKHEQAHGVSVPILEEDRLSPEEAEDKQDKAKRADQPRSSLTGAPRSDRADTNAERTILLVDNFQCFLATQERQVLYTEQGWHYYQQRTGYWRTVSRDFIAAELTRYIELINQSLWSVRQRNEAITLLQDRVHENEVPWDNRNVFVTKDGVGYDTDLETVVTPEASMYLTEASGVAANWVNGATAPLWDSVLDTLFNHVPSAELSDTKQMINEWLGAVLIRQKNNRKLSKALMLTGPAETGKSTLLAVARMVIGAERTADMSYSSLKTAHATEMLVGKSLWTDDELRMTGTDEASFKKLVTNEPAWINPKGLKAFSTKLNLSILVAGNTSPKITDESDGMWSRVLILPMLTKVALKKPDPDILAKLELEIDGMLQVFVTALSSLKTRGSFQIPAWIESATEETRIENQPYNQYIDTVLEVDAHSSLCAKHLGEAYAGFLLDEGRQSEAREVLNRRLKLPTMIRDRLGIPMKVTTARIGQSTVKVYPGLKIKKEHERLVTLGRQLSNSTAVVSPSEFGIKNQSLLKTVTKPPVAEKTQKSK